MTRRVSVLIAGTLAAFTASAAALGAVAVDRHHAAARRPAMPIPHRTPPAPAAHPRRVRSHPAPVRTRTVFPGPVHIDMVRRAIAWWNSAGADIHLVLTQRRRAADVVVLPYRPLGGAERGVTEMPCADPCRPNGGETITLSSATDYNRLQALAHELGHALGLGHTHVRMCSVMAPIQGEGCPTTGCPPLSPPLTGGRSSASGAPCRRTSRGGEDREARQLHGERRPCRRHHLAFELQADRLRAVCVGVWAIVVPVATSASAGSCARALSRA